MELCNLQSNNNILSSASANDNKTNKKYAVEDNIIYFERDWWLFRYILSFLRDGTIPNETSLLIALYREANFYNCLQLQYAIEERKVILFNFLLVYTYSI